MKFCLYKVVYLQDKNGTLFSSRDLLELVIEDRKSLKLSMREITSRGKVYYMETCDKEEVEHPITAGDKPPDQLAVYCMDMTFRRPDVNWGFAKKGHPTEDISLRIDSNEGEGFGAQTAAMYVPRTRHLIVQLNSNTSPGDIPMYFGHNEPGSAVKFKLESVVDANSLSNRRQKAKKHSRTSKMVFSFPVSRIEAIERYANSGISLSSMLESSGAHYFTCTLTARNGGKLEQPWVDGSRDSIIAAAEGHDADQDDPQKALRLKTWGSEYLAKDDMALDLFDARTIMEVHDQEVASSKGGRFLFDAETRGGQNQDTTRAKGRKQHLMDAYDRWSLGMFTTGSE